MNRTTCSDHDYSEPQGEDHLRQIIPVHPVGNQIPENTVIQQILPDQRLVFSNQANVVFQSPCVSLPPRVLLTSGKMVLPRISHGDQNVILSQVIPQAPILLSSPILQQPGNIIEGGSGTIVFANPQTTDHIENIQAAMQQYSVQTTEGTENEMSDKVKVDAVKEDDHQVEEGEESQDKIIGEEVRIVEDCENTGDPETNEVVTIEGGVQNSLVSNSKTQSRVETSKIVDDWDETNDSQQNVESRSDGPSRPDFF